MGVSEIHVFAAYSASAAERSVQPDDCEKALTELPPDLMKWLYSGNTRLGEDKIRWPRRYGRSRHMAMSTSLVSLFNAQGGMCCYCSEQMTLPSQRRQRKWPTDAEIASDAYRPAPTDITRDHILPKSQGGPGLLSNFAAACRLCNEEKGDLPLVIFLLARANNNLREVHRQQRHVKAALDAPRQR